MTPFLQLTGIAAPLPMSNVNTDMIIPVSFCNVLDKASCGVGLFRNLAHLADGTPNPDFVLNRPSYREASILIGGENFGCGSSREHAPWALAARGIRCVIASGFADIFSNNSFNNGILLIRLPAAVVETLMHDVANDAPNRLVVDLQAQTITRANGATICFDIDATRRHDLLHGLDDIDKTIASEQEIDQFEVAYAPTCAGLASLCGAAPCLDRGDA